MTTTLPLWQKTLPYHLWQDFRTRWHFKFTLPTVKRTEIEGVKLDISTLSPLMKNNLLQGRYEVQERLLASRHLTSADRVLELGGAIGFIGLFCQTKLGIRDYTTVEANPKTIKLLEANYALNGVAPNVIHAAAAAEDGTLDLDVGEDFWANRLAQGKAATTVAVPALSLRSLCQRLSYEPTTLICDIEGAESLLDFLSTARHYGQNHHGDAPEFVGVGTVHDMLTRLHNLGFRMEEEEGGTCLLRRATKV